MTQVSGSPVVELGNSSGIYRSELGSRETIDFGIEAVFVETLLDNEEDVESPLLMSPTFGTGYCDDTIHNGVDHFFSRTSDEEGGSVGLSWDPDTPSMEAKELETVFEDDVLSDSSSYLERSSSNCSIVSDMRDRSGSTWSAMTLYDRERSNSINTCGHRNRSNSSAGFRERSYSSTGTYHECTSYSSGSGYRQRSYSSSSDYSLMSNPLRQSYRVSFFYNNSAFAFLDPKGKSLTIQSHDRGEDSVWKVGC